MKEKRRQVSIYVCFLFSFYVCWCFSLSHYSHWALLLVKNILNSIQKNYSEFVNVKSMNQSVLHSAEKEREAEGEGESLSVPRSNKKYTEFCLFFFETFKIALNMLITMKIHSTNSTNVSN